LHYSERTHCRWFVLAFPGTPTGILVVDTFSRINANFYRPAFGPLSVFVQRAYMKLVRLLQSERCFVTSFGYAMQGNINDYIPMRVFFFGVWEPNLTQFMIETIKSGSTVVDVGANVGYYSLLMSRLVGAAGKVIAIEAATHTFSRLQRNLNLNSCENVSARNLAVAGWKGQIKLFRSPYGELNTGSATVVAYAGADEGSVVECDTLMSILGDDTQRVSFIKIDIEGAELPVLTEILTNKDQFMKPLIVVSELSSGNEPIIEQFQCHGFRCAFIENEYDIESYLKSVASKRTVRPSGLAPNKQRPPTADVVFVYNGGHR
jgi:FkbM family methyltransferase